MTSLLKSELVVRLWSRITGVQRRRPRVALRSNRDAIENGIAYVSEDRLTLGLVLWWLVRPRFGAWAAAGALAFMAVATVAGYCAGGAFGGGLDARELALFEALVAGSLLHVVVHQREGHHEAHA